MNLEILYEDKDVFVVNKPVGLLTHPTVETDTEPSVARILAAQVPEMNEVGDEPKLRPGIVHRLDKMASGVLIVAKNQSAFEFLKKQFQERTAKKEYLALVYGKMPKDAGVISFRITRSKRTGRMAARPQSSEEGREAITEYEVLKRYATTTLLKVNIKTGRTHQIRSHMHAVGHAIVGDDLYKAPKMRHVRKFEIERPFLHSAKLEVELPSGERRAFEAPLPKDLQDLLSQLR